MESGPCRCVSVHIGNKVSTVSATINNVVDLLPFSATVDCVEVNFVTSVYRALQFLHSFLGEKSSPDVITIWYDAVYYVVYLTLSKKLTCSQLSPPHGTNRKIGEKKYLKISPDLESDFISVGFNRFFTNLNPSDLQARFLSYSDLILVLVRFGL